MSMTPPSTPPVLKNVNMRLNAPTRPLAPAPQRPLVTQEVIEPDNMELPPAAPEAFPEAFPEASLVVSPEVNAGMTPDTPRSTLEAELQAGRAALENFKGKHAAEIALGQSLVV